MQSWRKFRGDNTRRKKHTKRAHALKMDKRNRKNESSKELRFVTSAEQMIPFLNRIRDTKEPNDSDTSDTNDSMDLNDEVSKTSDKLIIPISTVPTSATIAIPNIYEEYVNFIDLSVLNPIIDANHCQRDTLIESEISEQTFQFNSPPIRYLVHFVLNRFR